MGWAERKAISDGAVPCPAFSAATAGIFPGRPMEATVAAAERLKKFRRLNPSLFSRFFKVKLLWVEIVRRSPLSPLGMVSPAPPRRIELRHRCAARRTAGFPSAHPLEGILGLHLPHRKVVGILRGVKRGTCFQVKFHVAARANGSRSVIAGGKVHGSALDGGSLNGLLNCWQSIASFVTSSDDIFFRFEVRPKRPRPQPSP